LLILGLAHLSGFTLPTAKSMNFDLAIMLSPWGLFKFIFIESDHPIHNILFEPHRNPGSPTVLMWLLIFLSAASLIFMLKKFRNGS